MSENVKTRWRPILPPSISPSLPSFPPLSRTYLFCAIRPEVQYHKYTFSTLGFAKNASVVKLKPKMTTVQATPAERKLMEELEQMKVYHTLPLIFCTKKYPGRALSDKNKIFRT